MNRLSGSIAPLILFAFVLAPCLATADALSDAIRQAWDAKAEAQRLERSAEEARHRDYQLREETKVARFQTAYEYFASARSGFERAVAAFHSGASWLESFQSSHNPGTLDEAQQHLREAGRFYNDAISELHHGEESHNSAIEEYNHRLAREREEEAVKNRDDAFKLRERIQALIDEARKKKASARVIECLKEAHSSAFQAFVGFNGGTDKEIAQTPTRSG